MATAVVASAQTPIATIGLTPGWATFGQAVPQGAALSGLQVGSLLTQTDVKTRWPDGSIRFAVVTVNALTAGNYAITAATAASGAFTPALPTASVTLTIGTVTYTATLPTTTSADRWLSGPLVYEGRSVVPPLSPTDGYSAFLRVIFDTRVYADGAGRVDVAVENVLDKVGATTVTYDAAIAVNGQAVFTKAAVQHYYLTRWRKMFPFGTTPAAAITPDIAPFNNAGALPPYLPLVANIVSSPTGPSYDILQSGALTTNMPDHGGRPELAPYPDWTARYLVNKNPTQRTFVLANGDLAGSWPIHVREAENSLKTGVGSERLVSINQRPTLWLDERAQGGGWDYVKGTPMPIREYGSTVPGPGQSPLIPDNAHQPSLAYVPYLLTGDRYYAEEMAFWANYAMIRTYPGDGVRGSSGIIESNEVRGYGWGLRNVVDAAAMYPDASAVRSYLIAKVNNNLQWLDNYANAQDLATNPFQILWLFERPDGKQYISMWEQTYLMHAIDRARQQGFTGGLAHRDAIARFQLKLFTSDPDYPRAQAAPYIVSVGVPGANDTLASFTFFTSMAQIWAGTKGQERPFAGYYGPEARMSLLVGIQNAWAGAQGAYDYLWPFIGTSSTFCAAGANMPDLACRAGWALALPSTSPPPPPTAPAQLTSPAAGSTLTGSIQGFTWDAGLGVTSYRLDLGTSQGATNIFAGTASTATSQTVTGLPTDGSTIWVRLSSSINGSWQFVDYSFLTATITSGGNGGLSVKNAVAADGTGAVTAGPFSTMAGDLVIAFATAAGPAAGGQALTVTGGGLSWTRVTQANATPGVAEIWRASSTSALTSISVTSTPAVSTYTQSLTVVIFAGAAGVGASATAGTTGAPAVSLTATAAGSLIYGAGNDWDGAIARTLGPNQTMTHQWLSSGTGDTYWVQSATTPTASAGTVAQLNDTAPSSDRYNFAAVEIVRVPAPPTITWVAPASIVYGTALSAAQLNATASVPGTFVYTPPSGTVLSAGASQTLSVTFTPTDTANFAPATTTVAITVTKATPTITWVTPASIVSGTALSATQLNASANVGGTFVYAPPSGTVLGVGAGQTLLVTFTPADTINYNIATNSVAITVTAGPSVSLSATTAGAGAIVSATAANGPARPGDFIGLYDVGGVAVSWAYLNGIQTMPATGLSGATVPLMLPLAAGTYHARFYSASAQLLATSTSVTTTLPTVTVGATTAFAGTTVTVTVASGPGGTSDFVGLYDSLGNIVSWMYLNGTQTTPAMGISNASMTLTLPSTPGTYQVRLYNSKNVNVATSTPISLVTRQATVTLNSTVANAGGVVVATVANGPALAGDFVGLYDGNGVNFGWFYLNGTRVLPSTGVSDATVPFTLPPVAATYQVRFYNAKSSLLATSGAVTVALPTVTLGSLMANGSVSATVTNAPGTPGDWAGLCDASGNVLNWQYLNGTQTVPRVGVSSAVITFFLPPTGATYHVRLFNGSSTRVATSGTIVAPGPSVTVNSTTVNGGGRVTATITNGPGMPGDWAGLYDAAGNSVQWQYLNGTQVRPAIGLTTAVLNFDLPPTAGVYQVRLFNSTSAVVANSVSITTTASSVSVSGTGNAGAKLTATIANAPGTPGDWVGLYDSQGAAIAWSYLNGTQSKPAIGVTTADVAFMLPATSGTYSVRLFNERSTQVAASGAFTAVVASLTVSATNLRIGSAVTVTIVNAPGTVGDWAGLYDIAGNAVAWQYLNGTQTMPAAGTTSATLVFTIPSIPGTYVIRLFNGASTLISVTVPLSVT